MSPAFWSAAQVDSGSPFGVTCLVPSVPLVVPTVPGTPATVGVAAVALTAGHRLAHGAGTGALPCLVGIAEADRHPAPSTSLVPNVVLEVCRAPLPEVGGMAELDELTGSVLSVPVAAVLGAAACCQACQACQGRHTQGNPNSGMKVHGRFSVRVRGTRVAPCPIHETVNRPVHAGRHKNQTTGGAAKRDLPAGPPDTFGPPAAAALPAQRTH